MRPVIEKLRAGGDLTRAEVAEAIAQLLSDTTPDDAKADFLIALHEKGETAAEIVGFVEQLLARAIDPQIDAAALNGPMIDVCGTGGDGHDLFNVSTTIMFIVAAAGAVVVKHGNRGVTSRSGSADVLEALGVHIDLGPEQVRESADRFGLAFIFARRFHPAFRALAELRARLAKAKQRTIFNIIGPLLNPARPQRQLIGVYAPELTATFGEVLRQLGRERAWVVHGALESGGGIDDISTGGTTTLVDVAGDQIINGSLDARSLGVPLSSLSEIEGGDAEENARVVEAILDGSVDDAKRDLALVNAGGALVVAGLASDLGEGVALARQQIENGRALQKLRDLQEFQPNSSR